MHQYSVDNSKRKTVLYWIVAVSVIFSTILLYCWDKLSPIVDLLLQKSDLLLKIWDLLSRFELIPSIIQIPILFAFFNWLYNNHLWKCKWFQKWHGIPDLSGEWSGSLTSSYQNKKIDMTLVIKQTWTTISCRSAFKESLSYSESASLFTNDVRGPVLRFSFQNKSENLECGAQTYEGYNMLALEDDQLNGFYMNNRTNPNQTGGNIGTINLHKEQKNKLRDQSRSSQ